MIRNQVLCLGVGGRIPHLGVVDKIKNGQVRVELENGGYKIWLGRMLSPGPNCLVTIDDVQEEDQEVWVSTIHEGNDDWNGDSDRDTSDSDATTPESPCVRAKERSGKRSRAARNDYEYHDVVLLKSDTRPGYRTKGRPPDSLAKRPRLYRNPDASTSPDKSGRPRSGQQSPRKRRQLNDSAKAKEQLQQEIEHTLQSADEGCRDLRDVQRFLDDISKYTQESWEQDGAVRIDQVINLCSRFLRICHGFYEQPRKRRRREASPQPPQPQNNTYASAAAPAGGTRDLAQPNYGFTRQWDDSPLMRVSKATIAAVCLTPSRAYDILLGCVTAISADGIKCWMKLNPPTTGLRPVYRLSQRSLLTSEPIDGLVLMSRLAAVAAGWGPTLLRSYNPKSPQGWLSAEVSHLCHNGECFNPRHVWVEHAEHNRMRTTCRNKVIIELTDSTGDVLETIDPCRHRDTLPNGVRCRLPTLVLVDETGGLDVEPLKMKLYPKQRHAGPAWGGLEPPCQSYCVPAFADEPTAAYCIRLLRGEDVSSCAVLNPGNGWDEDGSRLAPPLEEDSDCT